MTSLLQGSDGIVIFLLVQYNNSKTHNHALVICLHQGDVSRLRDFRDEAMDQIRKAKDPSSEETLGEYFNRF
jgi:exocyst complex component 3